MWVLETHVVIDVEVQLLSRAQWQILNESDDIQRLNVVSVRAREEDLECQKKKRSCSKKSTNYMPL